MQWQYSFLTLRRPALWVIAMAIAVWPAVKAKSQVPCTYEISAIIQGPECGIFGFPPTIGTAISPNGRYVCGYYQQCTIGNDRAFVFDTTTSQFTTLPLPAGFSSSFANDVNDDGLVVGEISGTLIDRGFIYSVQTGQYTQLFEPLDPGGVCEVTGINSSGAVCGTRTIGGEPLYPTSAFTWSTKSGLIDLGVMNGPRSAASDLADDGTVTGWTGAGLANAGDRAFILQNNQITILPAVNDGISSLALAISNSGVIVGYGRIPIVDYPYFRYRAFVYSNEQMITLPPFPGYRHSFALDVTNDGMVLGLCRFLDNGKDSFLPFLWSDDVAQNLNDLLTSQKGLFVAQPYSIDDQNLITGQGSNQDGDVVAFLVNPLTVFGDLDENCRVNVDDLLTVINEWGKAKSIADINSDGIVDLVDLAMVLENWTFY